MPRTIHPFTQSLLATLLTAITLTAPASAADLDRNATLFGPFIEWSLSNPSVQGNPFDLIARVTFTHQPTGETRHTEMFHAGADTWKFRFTATRPGLWTFTTQSDDSDLNAKTGKITVAPATPSSNGFVSHNANRWTWSANRRPLVPRIVMYRSPDGYHNNPDRIDADLKLWFNEHGFNALHTAILCRWFDLSKTSSDQIDSNDPNPDPRTFDALELLITKAHAAGGFVHIWAWGDDSRRMTPTRWGINAKADRRLQRYIAARLGPLPGWTMGYGFDLWEWVNEEQLVAWHDNLQKRMFHPHLIGGRVHQHGQPLTKTITRRLSYIGYETHRPDYAAYVESLKLNPAKPVMMEDRFRIRDSRTYRAKDYNETLTRRGLWHAAMAGGVGNIWGYLLPSEGEHGMSRPYPNRAQLHTHAAFFADRFTADLAPANKLTDGACLTNEKRDRFIFYKEDTTQIRLDLSTMKSPTRAIAVDTTQPYREIDLGALHPRDQTWTAPRKSDWAIAVESAPVKQSRLSFTDVTQLAGVAGPTQRGRTGGHGVMWADVDRDNRPDLYITMIFENPMPELFFRNLDGAKFADEAAARGIADFDGGSHGACFADLDNDGDFDLYNGTTWHRSEHPAYNNLFRNDGAGRFSDVTRAAGLSLDKTWPTRAVLTFDMDNDGDLDLFAVTNYQGSNDPPGERNEAYRNDGNLKFTPIANGALLTAPCGQGATDTDFDGDGDIDVIAANRTGPVNILRNDGKGNFQLVPPESIGIQHPAHDGVTMADVNRDGRLDMLLAGKDFGHLYLNQPDGRFKFAQSFSGANGYMGAFADLDNDADFDLVFAGDNRCWLNDGRGRFQPGPAIPMNDINDPRGVAFADIDNDGDVDFAVACKRSRNVLIRNDLNAGNFLRLRLISPQGQAGAFGAKVYLYAPSDDAQTPRRLIAFREARSNNGYLGQDDPVLHFGLGAETSVDLIVRFLDKTTLERKNVPAAQTLTLDARQP